MNKRVVIVEPAGAPDNVFARYMKLPLLGPLYLGTLLRDSGFSVQILNENILGRHVEPADIDADYLLVGGITCTVSRGYEVAKMYRCRNPSGVVVFGGIHATFMPEEAAQYADYVVVGEAENVIVDLLRYGSDEHRVIGSPVTNLDKLPSPDLSLLAQSSTMPVAPLMTSRGCPFDCSFCTVTKMFGRHFRTASVETVMRDLEKVVQPFVFFYDDNLTANRKRAHQLCDALLQRKRDLKWSAQVRVDVARDDDLLEKMRAAGCVKVYVGFETLDEQALRAFRKQQTVDDIEQAVTALHRHRIAVHGMFVLGADEQGETAARDALAFCVRHHVDSAQFMILTPFPGTSLFDTMKKQGRLLHTDWSYYDAMHVVFRPTARTAIQVQRDMLDAFGRFYTYRGAIRDGVRAAWGALGTLKRAKLSTRQRIEENALLKIGGRATLRRFQRLNRSYFDLLAQA